MENICAGKISIDQTPATMVPLNVPVIYVKQNVSTFFPQYLGYIFFTNNDSEVTRLELVINYGHVSNLLPLFNLLPF